MTVTSTYSNKIYLPIIIKCGDSGCQSVGEPNDIADAITVSGGQTACEQVNRSTDCDDVHKIWIKEK
jgi:hypothetical protein